MAHIKAKELVTQVYPALFPWEGGSGAVGNRLHLSSGWGGVGSVMS